MDYLTSVIGILILSPMFAWAFCESDRKAAIEIAALVRQASEPETLTSGRIREMTRRLNECVTRQPAIEFSAQRLKEFLEVMALKAAPNRRYGFLQSDSEYLRDPEVLGMVALPREFGDGLPENWESLSQRNGWTFIPFVSSLVGNKPFNSYRRLTFYIPNYGEPPFRRDLYLQFSMPEIFTRIRDRIGPSEQLIDVIAVQRPDDSEVKPKIYFAEYKRNLSGRSPELKTRVSQCLSCHPNGMRNIIPAIGTLEPEFKVPLAKLNARLSSYKNLDLSHLFPMEKLGPSIGRSHGCVKCHAQGSDLQGSPREARHRGALNLFTLSSDIRSKTVDLLHMPLDLLSGSRGQALKSTLSKVTALSDSERARYRQYLVRPLELSRAGSEYDRALSFLRDRGHISAGDARFALDLLNQLRSQQARVFDSMMSEHKKSLEAWLLEAFSGVGSEAVCSSLVFPSER